MCDQPEKCSCGLNTGELGISVCNHLVCDDCAVLCEICGELLCQACVVKDSEGNKTCGGECLTVSEEYNSEDEQ